MKKIVLLLDKKKVLLKIYKNNVNVIIVDLDNKDIIIINFNNCYYKFK